MKPVLAHKIIILGILYSVLICATTLRATGQQTDAQQEARRLWQLALNAKGGRERLYGVQNILVSARAPFKRGLFQTGELRYEQFYVFPNRYWFWTDERATGLFPLKVEWVDLQREVAYLTYVNDRESPRRGGITPFKRSFFTKTGLLYLMETPWLKPTLGKVSTERVGLKKVDVVQTTVQGDRVDFYFDRTTHLPVRVVMHYASKTEIDLARTYVLDDYTEVNGIQMPRSVNAQGLKQQVSYQINVQYDSDLFERPPTIEAGPEAWKPKIDKSSASRPK